VAPLPPLFSDGLQDGRSAAAATHTQHRRCL
jgi:hypothetical protein